jgi:hypothetical protein
MLGRAGDLELELALDRAVPRDSAVSCSRHRG